MTVDIIRQKRTASITAMKLLGDIQHTTQYEIEKTGEDIGSIRYTIRPRRSPGFWAVRERNEVAIDGEDIIPTKPFIVVGNGNGMTEEVIGVIETSGFEVSPLLDSGGGAYLVSTPPRDRGT